jgi:hypothetical protein
MVYNMRVYNINNEQKKNAFMKKMMDSSMG